MSYNTFGHLFRVTTWGEATAPRLGPRWTAARPAWRSTRR
jgi:hypothetical protein